jgi:hypothetical protein
VSDAYQDQEQRIARQNSKTNTAKTCVSSNQNTTQQITKKHQERIAYQLHDQHPKTTTQQNCVVIKPSDLDRILVFTRVRWEEGIVWRHRAPTLVGSLVLTDHSLGTEQ